MRWDLAFSPGAVLRSAETHSLERGAKLTAPSIDWDLAFEALECGFGGRVIGRSSSPALGRY
jgi:hypothetical protein